MGRWRASSTHLSSPSSRLQVSVKVILPAPSTLQQDVWPSSGVRWTNVVECPNLPKAWQTRRTCLLPFVFNLAAIILHFFGPYSATSLRKCSSSCVAHEVTTLSAAKHQVHAG